MADARNAGDDPLTDSGQKAPSPGMDRRGFIAGLLGLIPGLACVSARKDRESEVPKKLRVLSYNIHHGEGMDGRIDLDRIASVIISELPDLVALQEVDVITERSKGVDQASELARLTGMYVAFGSNLAYGGGQYGNAVLSRFPILEHRNHSLPNPSNTEPRGVLEVTVSTSTKRDETPLTLLATHLDNSAEESRLASAEWINAFVHEHADASFLLAGDMNAVPGSVVMAELAGAWHSGDETPLPTVPVEHPQRQIDYILYRPRARWRTIEMRVLSVRVASDHLPIFAVLEMLPE